MITFLKNKHVIAALIIAPILALISYFAVDYYVAEVPHQLEQGEVYKLRAKSNCRWESGWCDLVNEDVVISITTDTKDYGYNQLLVESSIALQGIKYAVAKDSQTSSQPQSMLANNTSDTAWVSPSAVTINQTDNLQFAVAINGSIFYADVPSIFVQKDTSLQPNN